MSDFKNDTWDDFNAAVKGKSFVIFGASASVERYLSNMKQFDSSWSVACIVDNSSDKWGKDFGEYIIQKPDVLTSYDKDTVVLICSIHTAEIARQLENMGIHNYFSDHWMSTRIKVSYEQVVPSEEVKWIEEHVCDEESSKVLRAIVEKRKNDDVDYTDIKYFGESEYFIDEFWQPLEDGSEVFIDGGGFTGDTIEEFINWTKGNYKSVYTFEPDPNKAKMIEDNLWRWEGKVHLYKKGLYDKETELKFSEGTNLHSGKIVAGNTEDSISISTVALDNVVKERVTFLKMDIEGAEMAALEGARRIITQDKPKLAICIYHKLNDLWEIPRLILEMVPEYKIRIRHCGVRCRGTILYASIE